VTKPDDPRIRVEQQTVTDGATGVAIYVSNHSERAPRSAVPELPPHYLPRAAALAAVKAAVLAGETRRIGIGSTSRTGLHGLGGIGKTALAAAVARDPETVAAFPDGVHWLTLGQAPDVLALQRALLESLAREPVRLESVPLGTVAVQRAFAGKRCLVVLDDVWQRAVADAFAQLGDSSRLLITTRDRSILTALGAMRIDVDVLSMHDALGLLARWAEEPLGSLPLEASDVARECGRLPLSLALAGAQVRDRASWADLREALREGDLKFLDHADRSVFGALDASVQALPPDQAARYRQLAFVPEDALVPESIVVRLWTYEGMKERDARALVRTFASKALLFVDGAEDGRRGPGVLRLHDSQRDYLRLVARDASEAHGRLLDAHFAALPGEGTDPTRWASLDPGHDPGHAYLWQHLIHHLIEAEQHDVVEALVRDVRWLNAKAAASGVGSLLTDLATVVKRAPTEAGVGIERALRVEAGWLHQDATALPGLLYNRLRCDGLTSEEIARVATGLRPAARLRHPVRMGEGRAFRGHIDGVTACAYSPDGSRILSGSDDNTVREWDAATARELRRFEGHDSGVTACAYSPDGTRVVSASYDNTVREWDAATARELRRFEEHTDSVMACSYSQDGSRILSASLDRTLREWDAATGRELHRFEGHTAGVRACAYSPDGTRVVSASNDHTVREWETASGRELRCFVGHADSVGACAYSPDGTRVVSASVDQTIREWDAATGRERRRFEGNTINVNACLYSPDGSRVLSASWNMTVDEWDAARGRELRRFEGHTGGVMACAYSPDGSRVLSASRDRTVREWDAARGGKVVQFEGHTRQLAACAYSPDGTRVVSASHDHTVRVWDTSSGHELRRFVGHPFPITTCAYSPHGSRVLSGSAEGTLREWDVATGRELRRLEACGPSLTACAYSPDGSRVLSASWNTTLHEWDVACGRELRRFEGHTAGVNACAYSPDGSRVLSASVDQTIREWDAATGRELRRFEGHDHSVDACAYSPDGSRVLSASKDRSVREWDAASGRELQRFEGHADSVTACAYSPDGSRVLSASYDGTIVVWLREPRARLFTVHGAGPFMSVALRPGQFTAGDTRGNLWLLDCDLF
jgi:WD40 repeat protein